jgi:hypothetical protein
MASGAPDSGGQFVEAGQGFSGILLGSQALRWMMSGTVLGDVASRHQLYLAAKPSNVGVNVDELACPPAPSYGLQPSDEGVMLPVRHCTIPSCYSGRWCLSDGCEAPKLEYLMEG